MPEDLFYQILELHGIMLSKHDRQQLSVRAKGLSQAGTGASCIKYREALALINAPQALS